MENKKLLVKDTMQLFYTDSGTVVWVYAYFAGLGTDKMATTGHLKMLWEGLE
jgi:hypothetical protein